MPSAALMVRRRLHLVGSFALAAAAAVAQQSNDSADPLARWLPLVEAARSELDAGERAWLDDELFEIDLGRGALASARQRLPARLTRSDSRSVLQLLTAHVERGELAAARRLLPGTFARDQATALCVLAMAEARSADANLEQTLSRLPEANRQLLRQLTRAYIKDPTPRDEVRQALLALPTSAERDACLAVLIETAATAGDEEEVLASVAALSRGQAGMLRSLSLAAAANGDLAQAERLAARIDDPHFSALCWLELTGQAAVSGNLTATEKFWLQAEATRSGIKYLGFAWARAARARARLLQQNEARAAARELLKTMAERLATLEDKQSRKSSMLEIVLAQHELGAADDAATSFAALLRSYGDRDERLAAELRTDLAAALAAAGMVELALREQPDLGNPAVLYVFGEAFGRARAHAHVEAFWQRLPESPARIAFLRSYLLNSVRG